MSWVFYFLPGSINPAHFWWLFNSKTISSAHSLLN